MAEGRKTQEGKLQRGIVSLRGIIVKRVYLGGGLMEL